MAKLIITENGRDKIYEITDSELTIGSSAEADVQIQSPEASPIHVTVKQTPQGFQVLDMETKLGTVINGRPANAHVLANGDTIQIGSVKITYIGKGPARRAAAAAAPASRAARAQIEREAPAGTTTRSHYRRETWDSKLGGGGMAIIAVSAIVILAFIAWLVLKKSDTPEQTELFALKNARHALERDRDPEALAAAEKVLKDIKRTGLDANESKAWDELRRTVDQTRSIWDTTQATMSAEKDIKTLRHHASVTPNDVEGRARLAREFLEKYPDSQWRDEVEQTLAEATNDAAMTPERRKLAAIEKTVNELVWGQPVEPERQFRKALDAVLEADSDVQAVHADELQKMADALKEYSGRALRIRKNDVRHLLREGKPAEARAAMREMLDKLITEGFEIYLRSPEGGYSNPDTARLELETQKLMKEELERFKQTH